MYAINIHFIYPPFCLSLLESCDIVYHMNHLRTKINITAEHVQQWSLKGYHCCTCMVVTECLKTTVDWLLYYATTTIATYVLTYMCIATVSLKSVRYGTDLMQRHTRTRVLGHHSPSVRTRSSVSFNGLELGLERKLERAVRQTKNGIKGAYCYRL